MPIYKIRGSRSQERMARRSLARMRWVAVTISAALLVTAALMMMHMQ